MRQILHGEGWSFALVSPAEYLASEAAQHEHPGALAARLRWPSGRVLGALSASPCAAVGAGLRESVARAGGADHGMVGGPRRTGHGLFS